MYAIVDIETTGNTLKGNKITEISIFLHDGTQVVDEYTTLVNPMCEIPFYITALTGIDNSMTDSAPLFSEIAPKILSMTENAVFVAHSVHFDYNVIKYELEGIGMTFPRKKLCTVRLSRKLIPGLPSYSLGKLCGSLGIPIHDRHRAKGDAQATVLLFERLLQHPEASEVFAKAIKANSREATLPEMVSKQTINALPEKPGVYYFKDAKGKIIYVGKAINIKKRVLQHFYDRSTKEVQIRKEIADIDVELSGSELLALLMESAAIKHYYPKFNAAQKRSSKGYGVFTYEDRKGTWHLAFNNLRHVPDPLINFQQIGECRDFLKQLCDAYQLCPRYCQLQESLQCGSHYTLKSCTGVCEGKESLDTYNQRVHEAVDSIAKSHESYFIQERGRTPEEAAIVLIKEGVYKGYGFIDRSASVGNYEDLEAHITLQKDNADIQRILRWYCNRPGNLKNVSYLQLQE